MREAKTIAYVRQLCSLGLGADLIMPELFKSIARIAPYKYAVYFFTNDSYQVTNVFVEDYTAIHSLRLYMTEFINAREAEDWEPFSRYVKSHSGVTDRRDEAGAKFYRSALYNELMRPIHVMPPLIMHVRERGKYLGGADLFRSRHDPPFSVREKRALMGLIPYVSHAFTSQIDMKTCYSDTEESGMAVLACSGSIQFICPVAKRLAFLATHPVANAAALAKNTDGVIGGFLNSICNRLRAIFAGREASPPVIIHDNRWGRFIFRGYWLEGHGSEPYGPIGVYIKRQMPTSLVALSTLSYSNLSDRETQVTLLLLGGKSLPQIAKQLNVTHHTVTTYKRQIYEKLEVHSRSELMQRLRRNESSADHLH